MQTPGVAFIKPLRGDFMPTFTIVLMMLQTTGPHTSRQGSGGGSLPAEVHSGAGRERERQLPGRPCSPASPGAATLRWRTLAPVMAGPSAAGRAVLFWFYSAFARRFVWCLVLDYCHSLAEGILRLRLPARDSELVFRDFLWRFFFRPRFERELGEGMALVSAGMHLGLYSSA